VTFPFSHLRHLSAVRETPAFFCTHGALPRPERQLLTLRERKSMFLHLYNIYIYIYMLRCVQIATPSVPYFRSFTAPKTTRSSWQLHFYIYRRLLIITELLVSTIQQLTPGTSNAKWHVFTQFLYNHCRKGTSRASMTSD
jgi:hypothetical protein